MSYTTHPIPNKFDPQQALPDHLAHKPVFAMPYEAFDGPYAGQTDARYLSVGLAQWDHDEISVKAMRYTGTKWTRQAEELPLHRPIDMTLFLAKALFESEDGTIKLPPATFHQQDQEIEIHEEERSFGEKASFKEAAKNLTPIVKERLNVLYDFLHTLKEAKKI